MIINMKITTAICLTLFVFQNLLSQIVEAQSNVNVGNKEVHSTTIVNFNNMGNQITRFDSLAAALDAHDGEIAVFDGVYYLYGTSYDCGYEWGNKSSSFCGFKVYSSEDLINWSDKGFLFDAKTTLWQTRCNGSTYGCYRPHVIYNQSSKLYVLWINVYDNVVGYRVFTSKYPAGPFLEQANPKLVVNNDAPVAGLNNGDHDTFVDDDGTAYLAFTDWRTKGTIVIEKLTPDYLTGTGKYVKDISKGNTEAPSLFKRNGIYYLLYSDPNCGYCAGTGTSYRSAMSPLGPWSEEIKISSNSCGGQPSFVSVIKNGSDILFLYGSDLWNHGAKNEALANYFWAPLSFSGDGSINPIICQDTLNISEHFTLKSKVNSSVSINPTRLDGFVTSCDIRDSLQRSQSFVATSSGILTQVSFTTFKSGYPDSGLNISIYKANDLNQPTGKPLFSDLIPADSMGWAPKSIFISPVIYVTAGKRYAIVLKSTASVGCFGFEYTASNLVSGGVAHFSSDCGKIFIPEKNKMLMFQTFIKR